MSETETGEFLRDSSESPNVMEIHCSTMPFSNQSIMTVTIPGHVPYRELYRTHPDNTLITAFTLLRRVANDYAALLVKCSTTHEAAETPRISPELVKLQNQLGDTQDERNKLRVELEEITELNRLTVEMNEQRHREVATLRADLAELRSAIDAGNDSLEAFGDALTDEVSQREHRRDDLLRSALRVLDDLL